MTEKVPRAMGAEHFARLAQAYGGAIDRWPEQDRASAREFARTPEGMSVLAAAADLDRLLDAYALNNIDDGLKDRILARLLRRSRLRSWFRLSTAGIGLIGVGVAGALAGSIAIAVLTPGTASDATIASDQTATVFGDIGHDATAVQEAQ
ncbi:hypothetical protein [Rhizobium sp. BK602]|uniref:hypothetical protein n=1 Tax=Rhizobium sp. BK602 TaxID=2586986 RepID=UPI001620EC0C|nr:hypothetical protein [Rhizobium sp. BK602]MBB3612612.1 hypothetical protein [Rhizobium sp. BK602]